MDAIKIAQDPRRPVLKLYVREWSPPSPTLPASTLEYTWKDAKGAHPFTVTVWTTAEWARLTRKPESAQELANGCWIQVKVG